MAAKTIRSHGPSACAVELSRSDVDAGAALTVTVRVACAHGCDLSGRGVSIHDRDGSIVAEAVLVERDGAYAVEIAVKSPPVAGERVYRAVIAADVGETPLHEESDAEFSFTTMPHAAHPNAWGWPSAIVAGERFAFKVSDRCSSGCRLEGRPFRVLDENGTEIAAGMLGGDTWPGTSAVHFAAVEAMAPTAIGDCKWVLELPGSDGELPHGGGTFAFGIKVVGAPDCEVTIEAFDSQKQLPIKGIHVLMHPYRAVTDESGLARVKVAKGRYKVAISGRKYIPYQRVIEAEGDLKMRADLTLEPTGDDYLRE